MSSRPAVVRPEPSLGRLTRSGSLSERAEGTFTAARRALESGRNEDATALLEMTILEAEELGDVYERWPHQVRAWLTDQGVPQQDLDREAARLEGVIGARATNGIAAEWPDFERAVQHAVEQCSGSVAEAVAAIETARVTWLGIHDRAVDLVAGMVDVAVRLLGEGCLHGLWDHLMSDWYAAHERRYAVDHQPWELSREQLMTAIVDGFHAHLTGPERTGEIEVVEESDRIGFRFSPCGSGGRTLSSAATDGRPRSGPPYDFAVTTQPHDWAWNTVGICSYCVHCCLLNELMPIDRLGYPTRVIDPPVWPDDAADPTCTWWVYKHPDLVPDEVYARVGRSRHPEVRR